MGLPAYKKWKNTKVQWPESIPEHWELKQLRYLFNFGRGLGITKANLLDEGIPCINYGEIHSKFGFEVDPDRHELKCVDQAYLETGEKSLLEHGDFVFADTSEDIEGSGNFTYLNSELPTFAGYHTVVAKPATNNDARFLAYLIDSQIFRFQIRKNVSGVKVYSITQDILKNCYAWLPIGDEQKKIVNFLDHKTKQIDQLIEKKKALIEKLDEQRIAVITQAVTKGVDRKAKMKPSGVEWLGDIPEHWDVRRLRFCLNTNPVKSEVNQMESDTPVSFVPMNSVNEYGGMDASATKPLEEVYSGYTYFIENDVVVAKITPCFENGKGSLAKGLTNGIGFGTTEFHVLRSTEEIDADYIFFLTISHAFRDIGASEMLGAGGQKRIPEDFIKDFRLGIPNIEEQRRIVEYINFQLIKIDEMNNVSAQTISLYEEYRSALITSAVTGSIDVRNIKIPVSE